MGQVVWGGRTFSTPQQLAAWLAARGANYKTWAANHPAAAASLEGRSSTLPGTGDANPQGGAQTYQDLISGEPIGAYERGQLEAQNAAAAAQRAAAVKDAITRYGGLPPGFQDPYGDLAGLGNIPQNNAYSTLSQLTREFTHQRGNLNADLAARGVLSSGEKTLGDQEIGYQEGMARQNALDQLLQQIGGIDTQYAQGAADRAQQLSQIYNDAMQRLIDAGISPQQAASMASSVAAAAGASGATGSRTGSGVNPTASGSGNPQSGFGNPAVGPAAAAGASASGASRFFGARGAPPAGWQASYQLPGVKYQGLDPRTSWFNPQVAARNAARITSMPGYKPQSTSLFYR